MPVDYSSLQFQPHPTLSLPRVNSKRKPQDRKAKTAGEKVCDDCQQTLSGLKFNPRRRVCMRCQNKRIKRSAAKNIACFVCGRRFHAPPTQIRRSKSGNLTCSFTCRGVTKTGTGNVNWKPKAGGTCLTCHKPFAMHACRVGRTKYCSKLCMQTHPKKESPPSPKLSPSWKPHNWRGGNIERSCDGCGEMYIAKRSALTKGQGKCCSHRCWGKIMVIRQGGKIHTNARGGKRADLQDQYFRSSWEANWARYLNWLVSLHVILKWEYEPQTFEFMPIKKGNRFYTPDFKVYENNGSYAWHEVKGWMDDTSRVKLERMSRYYPQEKVIVIDKLQYQAVAKKVKRLITGWELPGRY